MFFREKHSNTSKSPVIQLVENYRVGAKVKLRKRIKNGRINSPEDVNTAIGSINRMAKTIAPFLVSIL